MQDHHVSPGNPRARQTLSELDRSLPNGLHDAWLESLAIDYVAGEIRLSLDLWVGDIEAAPGPEREAYRKAAVVLTGLVYCVCEPPDPACPYDEPGSLFVDCGDIRDLKVPPSISLPPLPEDAFANWIFVKDWNAFIYVAARDARLTWLP